MYGKDRLSLNILDLRSQGVLKAGWRGRKRWFEDGEETASVGIHTSQDRNSLWLKYTYRKGNEPREDLSYRVRIFWSRDSRGYRKTPSFLCPEEECGRATETISQVDGIFLCSHCRDQADEVDEAEREHQSRVNESAALIRVAYAVLDLPRGAKEPEVKVAYRQRAKELHSDHNPEQPEEAMQELNEAKEIFKRYFQDPRKLIDWRDFPLLRPLAMRLKQQLDQEPEQPEPAP